MKTTIAILLTTTLLGACSSYRKPEPKTAAEITQAVKQQKAETVVSNMLAAIDQREWKNFETAFAPETVVIVDEPTVMKPEEVTALIKPTYEYFDSTKHEVEEFKLDQSNDRLVGHAKVKRNLWKNAGLTSDVATVKGEYELEFVNDGEALKIMRMRFIRNGIEGNKKIVNDAMKTGPKLLTQVP